VQIFTIILIVTMSYVSRVVMSFVGCTFKVMGCIDTVLLLEVNLSQRLRF